MCSRASRRCRRCRACTAAPPQKRGCFVLDVQNNAEAITRAFQDHYCITLLSEETAPQQAARPESGFGQCPGVLARAGDRVCRAAPGRRRARPARSGPEDIAPKVAADPAYRNAKENTPYTARVAHDQALGKALQVLPKEDAQRYKLFVENDSLRKSVGNMVYAMTSQWWRG